MDSETEWVARGQRNSWILLAANAINGSGAITAVSLGGLTGSYLLADDKALATLPVAGFNLGVALGALPAAESQGSATDADVGFDHGLTSHTRLFRARRHAAPG